MTIENAQREMRSIYRGGAKAQAVSDVIWLISAALETFVSQSAGLVSLFLGGCLILLLTQLVLKLLGRPASASSANPLNGLAKEIAFIVPLHLCFSPSGGSHRLGLVGLASTANSDLKEEIGWPELAATVAQIRNQLPEEEKALVGVLTYNYDEAGAMNRHGLALGLPEALSDVNSYGLRGYSRPPPQTLIVIGYQRPYADFVLVENEITTVGRFHCPVSRRTDF